MSEAPPLKQPRLARWFKNPADLKPADLELATVQSVTSRHVQVSSSSRAEVVKHEAEVKHEASEKNGDAA